MTALVLAFSLLHPIMFPGLEPAPGLATPTSTRGTASSVRSVDEGDDQYQFVAGLYEKGHFDMVVREAQAFLRDHGRHAKATLARYRLGLALFELGDNEKAQPHFERLSRESDFEYRGEATLRLAQCQLAADELAAATRALESVLESGVDYLRIPATFLLAEARFRAEDFETASTHYAEVARAATAADGDYGKRAALGATWCFYRRGDHSGTLESARTFLRRHAGDALAGEVRFLQGEALLELGRPREALEAFDDVSGAHADSALRGSGFALAALDEPARAARAFDELLNRFPDSPYSAEAAFHRGVQLLEAGQTAAAREALADARVPTDAETLYWLGWAEFQDGAVNEAQSTLERAVRAGPSGDLGERIQALRGDVLRALGRDGDALDAYVSSGSDYSLYAAAVASINNGNAADAERLAGSLLREHADSPYRAQAELALGEALFLQDRWQEAEPAFERAAGGLQEPAERARCASRLAWCRYLQGDRADAAQRFEALARDGRDAEAHEAQFMAARARLEEGDATTAARWLESYLSQGDGERADEALLELARLRGPQGLRLYQRMLDAHPSSALLPDALYELAEQLAAAGRCPDATEHYERLLGEFPDHDLAAPGLYGLAWCQYEAGDLDAAVTSLRGFQRAGRVPENLVLSGLELLVFAECARGRAQEAVSVYERFAGLSPDDERTFALARTLTQSLREAGDTQRAQAILEDCLARVEDRGVMASALVEGVYLSLERDDVNDAEARARVAQRRAPEDPAVAEALFFVAEKHFEAGRDDKAAELYGDAAAIPGSPVAASALYKQGFANLRAGNAALAASAFEALTAKHEGDALFGESLFLAAEARYRMGEYAATVEHLARLRRDFPRHEVLPKALFRGGVALCQLERWNDAQSWLSDLQRRHADFENATEAELWRGRALSATGDRRGARQAFERVAARDRGVLAARARLELGHLRLDADELEGALSEYLKVAVLFASGDEVAEALWMAGQCLERLGDPDRARQQYLELQETHPNTTFATQAGERLQRLQ